MTRTGGSALHQLPGRAPGPAFSPDRACDGMLRGGPDADEVPEQPSYDGTPPSPTRDPAGSATAACTPPLPMCELTIDLDLVIYGATRVSRADATLLSPQKCMGLPKPGVATHDGALLQPAERVGHSLLRVCALGIHSLRFSAWEFTPQGFRLGHSLLRVTL